MVLCKFFQQGACRFGSKCHNEHFDAKQVLKADIESAINGKQWPLSSYGPFKDRPTIPNFIEDRSFEEVRLMCYEARQKNFFEQFVQQFNNQVNDANQKMKALLVMTPDILEVITNVYDSGGSDNIAPPAAKSSNPFGMPAGSSSTAGSIFAKSSTDMAGNIFGGGASAGGFAASKPSGVGIFGGASNQQAGSIFGGGTTAFGSTQTQQQQQNLIFSQAPKPPGRSIFGGGSSNTTQQMPMFGQQQPAVGGNLFAQAQQQQSAGGGTLNPFTQQQPQQQASIFGQSQQQQQNNIFTQAAAPTTNIFAQATQQPAAQQQGIFAQAASGPSAGQGIFAQAANPMAMQQSSNTAQGLFAQASQQTQNMFTQPTAPQQPQQQQTSQNIFQQSQPTANPISVQQQMQQQQSQAATVPGDTFKQAVQQQGDQSALSTSLYYRMEDLTQEEIEAFKADAFELGKLPLNPPPRELVN